MTNVFFIGILIILLTAYCFVLYLLYKFIKKKKPHDRHNNLTYFTTTYYYSYLQRLAFGHPLW